MCLAVPSGHRLVEDVGFPSDKVGEDMGPAALPAAPLESCEDPEWVHSPDALPWGVGADKSLSPLLALGADVLSTAQPAGGSPDQLQERSQAHSLSALHSPTMPGMQGVPFQAVGAILAGQYVSGRESCLVAFPVPAGIRASDHNLPGHAEHGEGQREPEAIPYKGRTCSTPCPGLRRQVRGS